MTEGSLSRHLFLLSKRRLVTKQRIQEEIQKSNWKRRLEGYFDDTVMENKNRGAKKRNQRRFHFFFYIHLSIHFLTVFEKRNAFFSFLVILSFIESRWFSVRWLYFSSNFLVCILFLHWQEMERESFEKIAHVNGNKGWISWRNILFDCLFPASLSGKQGFAIERFWCWRKESEGLVICCCFPLLQLPKETAPTQSLVPKSLFKRQAEGDCLSGEEYTSHDTTGRRNKRTGIRETMGKKRQRLKRKACKGRKSCGINTGKIQYSTIRYCKKTK